MLAISRGRLVTSRESGAQQQEFRTLHFQGSSAESLGDGRWRLHLEVVPHSVEWVDYDGALLYADQSPGFSWDGDASVILTLPPEVWSDQASIRIRLRL